ncbi:hypothetical protein [Bacillus sp. BP-3]|uniref:hypothetical protein n=1 Tax=Bacillus sp. BP-3 TaxID=3022773 RepID=UPI002330ADB3|nr:hypothetical protein [Bacillus sp. BP-3]MDC2867553.1 hypothetical protein [Bacillus sp. BP-3]
MFNMTKRLKNWKTWVAIASLIGFLLTKFGLTEAKTFVDELLPYLFTLGISLGIWTDHEDKGDNA